MPDVWPDWRIGRGTVSDLAGYVVDRAPRSLPVGAELRSAWNREGDAVDRAAQLYGLLLDRKIRYATEPFAPSGREIPGVGAAYQRIRSPEEVLQGVGSCLDLSLLYASLAVIAGIRPLLAIRLDNDPHAMVVLDVERPLSDGSQTEPDFWQVDRPGVFVPTEHDGWKQLSRRWLAIDVVGVAVDIRRETRTFANASGSSLTGGPWFLVDVPAAKSVVPEHFPPDGTVYPIHTQLPELREFRDYPGRRAMRRALEADMAHKPLVVVHGPGGRGKSMLAERLAWGADNGCGWLLNATDVPTLQASLAAAERAERGLADETGDRGELPTATEVEQYAQAALDRLRLAHVPWVVVLDNCDQPPDAPGLARYLPTPTRAGQVVIVTTRDKSWLPDGASSVPPLTADDLLLIGLPDVSVDHPLVANPLTAETVARLGIDLPSTAGHDPHDVVWDLVRETLGGQSRAVALAEMLAWAPPEPVDVAAAPDASHDQNVDAAASLVELRFVAPTTGLVAELAPGAPGPGTVAMHRLYGEAVRRAMWNVGADAAAGTLARVLGSPWGRSILTRTLDLPTLASLETHEVPRMSGGCSDRHAVGILWQGLGHVRERRGPVKRSEGYFHSALELLNGATDPYPVAEAHIGIARLINHERRAAEYGQAQGRIADARALLRHVPGTDAERLAEQGGALYWLIEQHRAGADPDPVSRLSRLCDVREELWLSFERRVRLWSGDEHVPRSAPPADAGLGPERAYFNLAGAHLAVAKARYLSGNPDDTAEDLAACDEVYSSVGRLRELRYGARPHPHHAACTHGRALAAYHRVTLLKDQSALPDAYQHAVTALRERWAVDEVGDVRKSIAFLVKVALAGGLTTAATDPHGAVGEMIDAALGELTGWLG